VIILDRYIYCYYIIMRKTHLEWVPDKNNVLDYKYLSDTSKAFRILENWWLFNEPIWVLDLEDLNNLEKWYFWYSAWYSYRAKERNLSKKEEQKFNDIEKSKWNLDIMNLVEISIWRLLEKYFFDNWDNVRVRKTTTFDDVNSWMDYIIEFLDEKNKVSDIVWVDLTISEDEFNLWKKGLREKSKPLDYLDFMKNKKAQSFDFIPRLVLKLDRNLAYSFTNNYFVEIIEKWDTLNNDELEANFELAINDLNLKGIWLKEDLFSLQIQEVIDNSKQKAVKLI